jgi:hypothetical protein
VVADKSVELIWKTEYEENNKGFEVERSQTTVWSSIGFVTARGSNEQGAGYRFLDTVSTEGVYFYRLKQIDLDGSIFFSAMTIVVPDTPGALVEADATE